MSEPIVKKPKIEESAVAKGHQAILVIDFGSQYTQLITRRYDLSTNVTQSFILQSI